MPVVQAIVDRHAGKRILEVGNVLSHYRPEQDHLVVDKYEDAPGVINRDVLELDDLGPFDLVVAISTLEHVGWDERPRDPDKAPQAALALTRLLAPGGRLVFTVPAGYNPALDAALRDGSIPLSSSAALRRIGQQQVVGGGGARGRLVSPVRLPSLRGEGGPVRVRRRRARLTAGSAGSRRGRAAASDLNVASASSTSAATPIQCASISFVL